MLFNSWQFLAFFPIVTILYFLLPQRFRNVLLLAASCYFYISFIPVYILILLFLIVLDYSLGLVIESSPQDKKKNWLVFSIAANVLTLVGFKYFDFFTGKHILLPIGLSFHTMQSMSYVIEVSRGTQKAERNFLTYALYVMFYPQLVAGPIERPQNLLKQFYEVHKVDVKRILSGLQLMLLGFYKKVVIADFISVMVNPVFKNPGQSSGTDFIFAALVFSMQIFCDFSGYSDIARGAARVMGFELSQNFYQPFGATNIAELWKRWHMTLTGWFRDYVYIPLGGSRKSAVRTIFNIMLVFLLSGLWHGTGWTFIVWSELNGLMTVILFFISRGGSMRLAFTNKALGVVATYLYFSFAGIFFRSSSMDDALFILSRLFSGGEISAGTFNIALTLGLIASLEFIHYVERNLHSIKEKLADRFWQKWIVFYVVAVVYFVLTYLSLTSQNEFEQPFIYFQF